MKRNNIQAPMHVLPNLQNPLELETNASGYVMGAFFMQGGRLICYHSKVFHGVVINYPIYIKEICDLVQGVKKWNHCLIGNEIIIHTYHQPLKYLQAQSKLQQIGPYKWMGFLQKFHLIIKYKKGSTNKLEDILSKPPTSKISYLWNIMYMDHFTHNAYKEAYIEDEDLKEVFQ